MNKKKKVAEELEEWARANDEVTRELERLVREQDHASEQDHAREVAKPAA